jgi:hypothetical protein
VEGPCLQIEWRDKKVGKGWLTSHYYPDTKTSNKSAELACFEYFKKRRCEIRGMTWCWGEIPSYVSSKRRLVIG